MYNEGYFYNALKRDIAMVKGDTMSFGFELKGLEGETPDKVTFSCKSTIEDDYTVFTVSTDDTIDFVSYDAETDTLTYTVRIPPYKTAELELGRYYYDLKVEVNNDIITLMIGRLSIEYLHHLFMKMVMMIFTRLLIFPLLERKYIRNISFRISVLKSIISLLILPPILPQIW